MFVHRNFLFSVLEGFFKISSYNLSELCDKLEYADFKETIEEMIIAFEKSDYQIFGKKIVKRFLFDSAISDFLGCKLIIENMWYFISATIESDTDIEFIFEHVMRSVHIEFYIA